MQQTGKPDDVNDVNISTVQNKYANLDILVIVTLKGLLYDVPPFI